jgi:Mg2+ and Co2+ transporter CorA
MEDFGDYIFVVLKMLCHDTKTDEVRGEQVSLILGPHFVISFQEVEGDVLNSIRDRIHKAKGRITIFIPITFIAGIYGVNFAFMPELGWRASRW